MAEKDKKNRIEREMMEQMPKKILVVDDDYSFCKFLKEYLARLGYAVTISMNGEQALDLIREEKPDLMTLDIRMPGVNGYDILEKLRQETSPPQVVVISAIDTPEMEEQLTRSGAHAVLHKPVNLGDLGQTVKGLLG